MIFNWVIFSLYFSTSLFILVTGILTRKKRLLVNGVLLIIATSLLTGYIERDINSSWILPVNLLVLGIWIIVFYTQSLREIKVVVRNYYKARLQYSTLMDEQKRIPPSTNKPSIILKSKATLQVKDICYIKFDGPYIEYYLNNRKKPEIEVDQFSKLSKREKKILVKLADKKNRSQVAQEMNIKASTYDSYHKSIKQKLRIRSTIEWGYLLIEFNEYNNKLETITH